MSRDKYKKKKKRHTIWVHCLVCRYKQLRPLYNWSGKRLVMSCSVKHRKYCERGSARHDASARVCERRAGTHTHTHTERMQRASQESSSVNMESVHENHNMILFLIQYSLGVCFSFLWIFMFCCRSMRFSFFFQ